MAFLKGSVAIVTGGGSGIGRATSLALAQEGAHVVVVSRTQAAIQETLRQIVSQSGNNPDSLSLQLDVTREEDMWKMVEETTARFGRIDILIASAGISKGQSSRSVPSTATQTSVEAWNEVVHTNVTGTFLSNRAVLPIMVKQRSGIIMNIASFPAGIKGQPFAAAYSASKFAVAGFSEALAEEVRSFGIKVHALFPGLVQTPLTSRTTLSARFGPALPVERVADYILFQLGLPDDTVLLSRHHLGYTVLRHTLVSIDQWPR